MDFLHPADWLVIVAYLAAMIVMGWWLGRGQTSTRDYFLGGKDIPWWGVSLSIIATETSALTFITIPAAVFLEGGNLGFIQVVLGFVTARVILAMFFVPLYFGGEIYSPYQLLRDRFGKASGQTASVFFLIAGTLAAGVRVYVTCIPIELILGIKISWAIVLFVSLSLIYTFLGGIKAVIWTDALQFFFLVGGGLFAAFYIPSLLPQGWSGMMEMAGAAGKLEWLNPLPSSDTLMGMPYNLVMGLVGGAIFGMSTHGADQLIVQRVLTCRNIQDGRRSLILSAVVILPLFLLFLFVGVGLWSYFEVADMKIPLPEGTAGFKQADYVFPIFIITETPVVARGLLIVGILSAAMSSISSALSALASVSTMDLLKPLLKSDDPGRLLRFSKVSTIGWGIVLAAVAFLTRDVKSALPIAFKLTGLTSGGMLGAILLAIIWHRGSSLPVVTGMLTSLAGMIFISVRFGSEVAWPWYAAIGAALTVVTATLLRTILAPPQDPGP